jgi:lia operon protein LiaG
MTSGSNPRRLVAACALWVAAAAGGTAQAAEFERTFTFDTQDLTVADLVGAVQVEAAPGSEFRVVVRVRGADADEKHIRFQQKQGSKAELAVLFPVEEHRKYVYPEMRGGRSQFSAHGDDHDLLSELLGLAGGDRIEVRGRPWNDALELWADVTIQVPKGRDVEVHLGCGEIDAGGVEGDVELRARSGAVSANDIDGSLLADTGSGSVTVRGVRGPVNIDTGSGGVTVADVQAKDDEVRVDTGSGSVHASDVTAQILFVDTGSGSVELSGITVDDLEVDTGSGGVDASDLSSDSVSIDTGSGGVDLDLVRLAKGRYLIDTGSGGIRVALPREISAEFECSTGSGSIVADIEGVSLSRRDRQQARFEVGSGDADIRLSTGSGSIRLQQGAATARR